MLKFENEIRVAAKKHGIPFELLYTQVGQESSYNLNAVSPCGAEGLLQLMPATGKEMGLKEGEAFDPVKNLDAGAKYLAKKYKEVKFIVKAIPLANNSCSDNDCWMMALASYNGGFGYVLQAIKLCAPGGLFVNWGNVSLMLKTERCQVRGKRPDYPQMIGYVNKIWKAYKGASSGSF